MSVSSRRFGRAALALVIIGELGAGAGVVYVHSRDAATPVSVDDAVRRFHAQGRTGTSGDAGEDQDFAATTVTTATSESHPTVSESPSTVVPGEGEAPPSDTDSVEASQPSLPADGVYVYATSGYEETDAVGGARHEYPAETTVTLRREGCGLRARWDVLEERWDEWETCVTEAGEEWSTFTTYHEFFDQSETREYGCDPGSLLRPARPEPGMTWRTRCEDADSWIEEDATVVGKETVEIGGEAIETWRVRMEGTTGGNTRGTSLHEYWFETSGDGLMVKTTGFIDAAADSPYGIGTVSYREEYEMVLTTLEPRT